MVTILAFGGTYGENNTGAILGDLARTSPATLSPRGTITWAELAALLMRFEQNMLHK